MAQEKVFASDNSNGSHLLQPFPTNPQAKVILVHVMPRNDHVTFACGFHAELIKTIRQSAVHTLYD